MTTAEVEELLATHRRHRNTRSCTGCDWTPPAPGRTSDRLDVLARNVAFNRHLALLITQEPRSPYHRRTC